MLGCRLMDGDPSFSGKSPLRPATPAPDSVSLEIYWARYPWDDEELNGSLWNEVDENRIPAATRRALADNGLRAGVVGSIVPAALARALQLDGLPDDAEPREQTDAEKRREVAELLTDPTVTRRRRQLRPGTRLELQASELFDQMPLLVSRGGELSGRTYSAAQAMYALEIEQQADRTIRLVLTPEVHHGRPQTRYTSGGDGILRMEPMRDHEVFADLRTKVSLAPGEMLLLAGTADASGRLGHFFHTVDAAAGRQRKLVIIRLAQLPESQAFAGDRFDWPW